ncbi:MAG TPA: hypothetical protein VJB69_01240 [Candidatus Paceibacterota bacterium]
MINFYWGANRDEARRAARAAVAALRQKFPTAPALEFSGEVLSPEGLEEVMVARPLLGDLTVIFFDHLLINPPLAKFIADYLAKLASSENRFIFWEDELSEELMAKIVETGGKAEEFKTPLVPKQKNTESAKLFAIADALGSRDRKQAWLLYHDALRQGLPSEEVFWKFVWKVKTLLLVATASPDIVLPLKPYPLAQARRQIGKYQPGELAKLSARLVTLYYNARRGLTDFDLALERLILEL